MVEIINGLNDAAPEEQHAIFEALSKANLENCFCITDTRQGAFSVIAGSPDKIAALVTNAFATKSLYSQSYVFECVNKVIESLNGAFGLGWRKD